MDTANRPRVVVTIHGIRTRGVWQKKITPYLARHGLVPYHIDYGWFPAIWFFFGPLRERRLGAVREELRNLLAQVGAGRVSIIAHSFGTYLAMESLLRENGGLRYDRVVLTGSIVPLDFDWKSIFDRGWVIAARNERSTGDNVVRLAHWVSNNSLMRWLAGGLRAGRSGAEPFCPTSPQLLDDSIVGGHSETHNALKFERWARFIAYPRLPPDVLERVVAEMQALRQHAGSILHEAPERIRVNLFAPLGGALRIVPGAHDNMNWAPELGLKIERGHGATGSAFETGDPCIVVKRGGGWSGNHLPGDELAKVNPALRWVISLPLKSEARGTVVAVVNVDGLDNVPEPFEDVTGEECQAVLLALHLGMLKNFLPCLEAAFKGEQLEQVAR